MMNSVQFVHWQVWGDNHTVPLSDSAAASVSLYLPGSKPYPDHRADNMEIARTAMTIILPHVVKVAGQMLTKCFTASDREAITRPTVQAPIVEDLVIDKHPE